MRLGAPCLTAFSLSALVPAAPRTVAAASHQQPRNQGIYLPFGTYTANLAPFDIQKGETAEAETP